MNLRRWIFPALVPVALVASVALLAGCTLKKKAPVKFDYVVETARPGGPQAGTSTATLRVRNLSVASPYEGRSFVYRTSELGYETDFYHEFLVAPHALLTEQVRHWLDRSGLFAAVLDPASKADATQSLEGNVSALYADFRDKAAPKAVLAIHFVLLDHREAAAAKIIFRRSYHQEIPADGRKAEALVKAWSQALEKILTSLEEDLSKVGRDAVKYQ